MANPNNIALNQPLKESGGGQGGITLMYPRQWFSGGEPPEMGHGFPPRPEAVGEPKTARWRTAILAPGLSKRAR